METIRIGGQQVVGFALGDAAAPPKSVGTARGLVGIGAAFGGAFGGLLSTLPASAIANAIGGPEEARQGWFGLVTAVGTLASAAAGAAIAMPSSVAPTT